MEEQIKISVLIPTYNVETYIDQCLESVMNQTLREIEIIVVDDCSTDETISHIEDTAERDARIRILRHPENLGLLQTRKDAVLVSRGEYIMFVDADDYLEPEACAAAYDAAVSSGAEIVHFDTVVENFGNLSKNKIAESQRTVKPYAGNDLAQPLLTACFVKEQFSFNLWGKLFDGALLRRVYPQTTDRAIYTAQDAYQFFMILLEAKHYFALQKTLYHYCFGRGKYCHAVETLESFQKKCGSTEACRAVDEQLAAMDLPDISEEERTRLGAAWEAAEALKRRILKNILNAFLERVKTEDQAEAYLIMEKAWQVDPPAFAGMLAQVGWGKRKAVAAALAGADFLKFQPRPIKTIALYFYKLRNGGAERVVALLSTLFAELRDENGNPRYKVVLITEEEPNEEDYPVSPLVIRECIPSRDDSVAENYPARSAAWARIVRQHGVDVVLYSQWRTIQHVWDILSIKRTEKRPAVVFHTHNWFATMYKEQADRVDERKEAFPLTDGVVVLSEMDRVYWSRVTPRVYKIPNPCFTKASEVKRACFGKHILWIARIHEQKQPLEVPRIMREVIARDPEIVCHVVGDEDEKLRVQLEESIAAEGLSDNMILEGFHSKVAPFYESCSIYLMTSHYEGFALTLYEAASYGLPTVMYELPWLSYCTDMKGWVSVPQRDAKAAAEAIVRILNDPDEWKKRSDALYRSALKYEQTDITGCWLSLLSDLEQGRVPEYPEIDSTTKILLDQITYFHGIAVRGLIKERNKFRKSTEELQKQLETSQNNTKKAQTEAKKAQAEAKKAQAEAKKAQAEAKKAQAEAKKTETDAKKAQEAETLALKNEAKAREAEKKLREKLNRIENSRTYRLARLLGKPFRLLKRLLKRTSSSGKEGK